MAVKDFKLPVCDQCGEAWLPAAGPARNDIRAYDAAQRAKGLKGKPVRCGKCKSVKWDENYRKNGEQKAPVTETVPEVSRQDVTATVCGLSENPSPQLLRSLGSVAAAATKKLCRHRMLDCAICQN